jgi:TonB family protein
MSSSKNQTAVTNSEDENYETAVLEFLDKELAASQPSRSPGDQSAELDAIVTDLLKQVITESDRLQEGETSASKDEAVSMISSLILEQTESPEPSDLVSNLDRGLSQIVSTEDLWESGCADAQPQEKVSELESSTLEQPVPESAVPDSLNLDDISLESLGLENTSLDAGGLDSIGPAIAEPFAPTPEAPVEDAESRPPKVLPKEKTTKPRSSVYPNVMFQPIAPPRRKPSVKAIALAGSLIAVAAGIYFFLSSRGGAPEVASVSPTVSAPAVAEVDNQVPPPSAQAPSRTDRQKKASPSPRSFSTAPPPKTASVNTAQANPVPGKSAQMPPVPQPAKNSNTTTASTQPPAAAGKLEAKPAVAEKMVPDKLSTPPSAAMPASAVSGSPSFDTDDSVSPSPATSANTILVTETVDNAPPQLLASAPAKLDPLQPRSQDLLAAPARSRVSIPPVPISQPNPVYPEIALRNRISAAVTLELQVDERGRVTRAIPVNGPTVFHSAAVAAALKWRYKPASINGVNVPSPVKVTMNFALNK